MLKRALSISVMTLVVVFVVASMATAYTVATVGGYGPYQTGSGGEFTLLPGDGLQVDLNAYGATTKNFVQTGTFQTFCLEEREYIYSNTTFDAIVNTAAVLGGTSTSDPISIGTAYLYSQFAAGALANYDYSRTGARASTQDLQNAIWFLEGEGGVDNYFVAQAMAALHLTTVDALMADANGAFNVGVLNLYAQGHPGDLNYLRQDQLVMLPTPIPSAVWLLGSGMLGLIGIRRWSRRT